ncbi:MAG: GntR family transcriptional regulator [Acidimicrobiales bacterium]|nr:GntR family transcriptional regulator [Acidimicrobiales bacterium]
MTAPILPRSPGASLHHQLSTILRAAITSGRFGPGDYLPGENNLVSTYAVSRATVRRALLTLEGDGLIERRAGKGTRVIASGTSIVSRSMESHKRALARGAKKTTIRVLGIDEMAAPAQVAAALRLPDRSQVVAIARIRYLGKRPLRYMITYLEPDVGAALDRGSVETTTIVELLEQMGRPVQRAEDEIGATLADPLMADALGRRAGDPLLEMTRVMYDSLGDPVAYQWTVLSPEVFKLRVVIASEGRVPSLADVDELQPATELS